MQGQENALFLTRKFTAVIQLKSAGWRLDNLVNKGLFPLGCYDTVTHIVNVLTAV
jgi:multisubunit Na+/H+ antiporter MnhB subunit